MHKIEEVLRGDKLEGRELGNPSKLNCQFQF